MIAVIYRMVRARRGHAATVFALAALAIAASVAAPVYLLAAGRSLVAAQVAAATPREVTITAQQLVVYPPSLNGEIPALEGDAVTFENEAADIVRTAGFHSVYGADTQVLVATGAPDLLFGHIHALASRDHSCEHVVLVAGRCPGGPNEVIVGEALARELAVAPGATVNLQSIQFEFGSGNGPPKRVPGGPTRPMSVVGVYRPADPAAAFWGLDVLDTPLDAANLPLLTNLPTLSGLPHQQELRSVVAEPLPGTITADRMDQLRADLDKTLVGRDGIVPSSGLVQLLGTFTTELQTLKVAPTFAAAALVVLCWFVIFLAMAHTTEARRAELGLMKLRGVSGPDQTWLALAENVVALVAGGFVGYLAGHAAIWLVAQTVLPVPVAVPVTLSPLPYAALTLVGAIGAGVLALRRDLTAPALELMRRVPSRLGRLRGLLLAIVVAALAAASVAQLHSDPGDLSGLGVLAPALAVLAGGLLLARLLDPIVGWLGRRALRRGRLAPALASLHVARRGNGGRALALLVVAVGLFGYAAIAADTADRVRTRDARQSIGADRVVSVGSIRPDQLVRAVREVDPDGQYAMAAMIRTDQQRGDLLAVDSARLPVVAFWPDGAPVAVSSVSARLRPAVAPVVTVTGTSLVLRATVPNPTPGRVLTIQAWVAPANGEPATSVQFPRIKPGTADYRADVPCAQGCRLGNLTAQQTQTPVDSDNAVDVASSEEGTVVLNSLRQTGPDQELVSASSFGGWHDRSRSALELTPDPSGLRIGIARVSDRAAPIGPPDTPAALPMVAAGGQYFVSIDTLAGSDVPAESVATMPSLPRAGNRGALVDLEYFARYTENATPTSLGQVWLNDRAPADVLDRLRDAGLVVTTDRRLSVDLKTARQRPEAIGLDFFLGVALLGVILGLAGLALVAGVERRSRAEELRNLLIQGLPRRTLRSASLRSYLLLAVPAALFGAIVAEAAWTLTRAGIPTGEPVTAGFALVLPGTRAVLAWVATAVVLLLAAGILGTALARAADTTGPRGGSSERSPA